MNNSMRGRFSAPDTDSLSRKLVSISERVGGRVSLAAQHRNAGAGPIQIAPPVGAATM